MRYAAAVLLGVFLGVPLARAQASASFELTESTFNSGGDPRDGSFAASASFHIELDAIGDAVAGAAPASVSFHGDAGFVPDYPPPGEVTSLLFADETTLTWSPERSEGSYDVYRDVLTSLPGGFGACLASGSSSESAADAGTPAAGQGWFYLVTARNLLGEEGTKGFETSGTERGNGAPCP